MRTLEAPELNRINHIIMAAEEATNYSPCAKSQRGAIAFRNGEILGRGVNHPSLPRECKAGLCQGVCRYYTVHAERDACQDALSKGFSLDGASVLHMKRKGGVVVPVDSVGCIDCSTYFMDLKVGGISILELILQQRQRDRVLFVAYSSEEFYRLSKDEQNGA